LISASTDLFEPLLGLRDLGLSSTQIASDQEVQQLVYLLDRAGARFNYRFKWDVFGPYSVELAEEIADFDGQEASDLDATPSQQLADAVETIRPLLVPPADAHLSRPVWLRLIMCVDFICSRAHLALNNGDRPPLLKHNFTQEQIELARNARAVLDG